MENNKVLRLVIIDSGIDVDSLPNHIDRLSGIGIKDDNGYIEIIDDWKDEIGHGTIIFNLISYYLETSIEVMTIKVFSNTATCNPLLISAALQYCYDKVDCNIILISSGTLYSNLELHNIIIKLSNKGVCIVSAFDNETALSYPAAYKEVIGVDVNCEYKKVHQYDIVENDIIDIRGADVFFRTKGLNNNAIIVHGSSFYCSYIVAKIINNNLLWSNKRTIIDFLKNHAQKIYSITKSLDASTTLFVNKAIVFPFNKEIHSIAAFEDLIKFEIIDYYDIRQKGLINRQVFDILKYTGNKHIIKNFDEIEWMSGFDTFICGHTWEISRLLNFNVLDYIVKQCVLHNKKLICFDDISSYVVDYPSLIAWYPATNPSLIPIHRFGKLRSPGVPVVGVFGTSSQQGKMTVQLIIRRALLESGIRVCNIGSEPESVLFGFEFSYAFGYGACDSFAPEEMIIALNEAVYNLEDKGCDIVIAGSQSGTIPHQLRNLRMLPLKQYYFLLGVQPDSIVLCVNSFDDFEYIERTIMFFEATVKARVLCLVVSYVSDKKIATSKKPIESFRNHFCVPVFDLTDLCGDAFVQLFKDYYGGKK